MDSVPRLIAIPEADYNPAIHEYPIASEYVERGSLVSLDYDGVAYVVKPIDPRFPRLAGIALEDAAEHMHIRLAAKKFPAQPLEIWVVVKDGAE